MRQRLITVFITGIFLTGSAAAVDYPLSNDEEQKIESEFDSLPIPSFIESQVCKDEVNLHLRDEGDTIGLDFGDGCDLVEIKDSEFDNPDATLSTSTSALKRMYENRNNLVRLEQIFRNEVSVGDPASEGGGKKGAEGNRNGQAGTVLESVVSDIVNTFVGSLPF